MPIPLLDIARQNRAFSEELLERTRGLLDSGQYILGPEVEAFEADLARFLGVPDAVFVSSGTDALVLSLMSLGIGPGDEVLCPSFTFFATAGAVVRVGARPVFVDACPVCFNLSIDDAAAKVSGRTRAIIPVHLFGQAAEMDGVLALASAHGLAVIEDGAQSFGAAYRGRPLGTIGELGCLSFFPSKNLGAWGDAGAVVGKHAEVMREVRIRRVHGMEPKYHHHRIGGNFRGDPLQALLLRLKLPHLEHFNQLRTGHAEAYREAFRAGDARIPADGECACERPEQGEFFDGDVPLVLPSVYPHNTGIWNQFTLRVPGGRRDGLRQWLLDRGIGCEIYYPVPLHEQPCFREFDPAPCPVASRLAAEVLSLPVFPELSEAERGEVIAAVQSFIAASAGDQRSRRKQEGEGIG